MSIVIQQACIADATAIAEVHIISLRAVYQGQIPAELLDSKTIKQRAGHWQAWLKRSQASTIVARVDGVIAGFCALHPVKDESVKGPTAGIPVIYVLPSYWRRGIGRLMCKEQLTEACARGFSEIVLWVLESNQRARDFYNSLGFLPDGKYRVFLEHSNVRLHELRYRIKTSQYDNS